MIKAGQRIRELRLRRGLTQKTLAGEQMTRNMLSLIENGLASPSIANIRYIARQLGVPMGYFFAENSEEEGKYWKLSIIGPLRSDFASGKLRECIAALQSLPAPAIDDETALLGAKVYFQLALRCASGYEMRSAIGHLRTAAEYLHKTVYAGEDLQRAIVYYRDLVQVLTMMGDIPEQLCDLHNACMYVPLDMLLYFQAIQAKSSGRNVLQQEQFWHASIRDSYYSRHLHAINAEEIDLPMLRALLNDPALPFPMRSRLYSDVEDAANRAGDYKLAYTAARKKLELVELSKK